MAVSCQQRDCARGLCLLGGDSIQGTVSFHALFKYNRIRIEPIYNNEVEILWRKNRVQRLYLNFISTLEIFILISMVLKILQMIRKYKK